MEAALKKSVLTHVVLASALLMAPAIASAQQETGGIEPSPLLMAQATTGTQQTNVPPEAQRAEDTVARTVRRFRIGVDGGVGLDPELIMFGAHGAFGPIFKKEIEFRPGFEFGLGEVTTMFGINLDVLYILPGSSSTTRWTPYIGAGPNFALNHRAFSTEDEEDVEEDSRFDFSDTSFEGGFNFIAGARNQRGVFFELKATAYGVSTIRLMGGFNF